MKDNVGASDQISFVLNGVPVVPGQQPVQPDTQQPVEPDKQDTINIE